MISDSILFYENFEFKRIESPWFVPIYVANITKPIDKENFIINNSDLCLVSSGEQSFLDLYLKNYLIKCQFQTVTPCFRNEKNLDFTHNLWFIKNELIKTDVVNLFELEKLTEIAFKFMSKYLNNLHIVKTNDGFDIENSKTGIEVGSYGIRNCEFLNWIYGTGLAEPRFSNQIK